MAIWDGSEGKLLHTLSKRNNAITVARFSPDERHLLIGYLNRTIELWDVTSGQRVQHWSADARNPWCPTGAAILAVGFSESPTTFYALAGDGRLMELSRG